MAYKVSTVAWNGGSFEPPKKSTPLNKVQIVDHQSLKEANLHIKQMNRIYLKSGSGDYKITLIFNKDKNKDLADAIQEYYKSTIKPKPKTKTKPKTKIKSK